MVWSPFPGIVEGLKYVLVCRWSTGRENIPIEHLAIASPAQYSVQSARQCGGPVNQVVWEVRIIFGLVLNYYYLTYYLYGLFAEWC